LWVACLRRNAIGSWRKVKPAETEKDTKTEKETDTESEQNTAPKANAQECETNATIQDPRFQLELQCTENMNMILASISFKLISINKRFSQIKSLMKNIPFS